MHLDGAGNEIEKYKYDAFGSPTITDWSGNLRTNSAYGNRYMFTGRDYIINLALYDMRNGLTIPVMGRFYQTDPIGFAGDEWNLYRFAGHNPLLGGDPAGLDGLDTGSPLSADQFPGSGDFSDFSSFGEDWSYNGGFEPALEIVVIGLYVESQYPLAGSDDPKDYIDIGGDLASEPFSSTVGSNPMLSTSTTSSSTVISSSTTVQNQAANNPVPKATILFTS